MNVLEIYPAFAWWLCGSNAAEIEAAREQVSRDPAVAEADHRAFCLVGDAAAFELLPDAFDEIIVRYDPTPLKRLVLRRHTRPWLKPGAQLRFEPAQVEYSNTSPDLPRLSVYPVISWRSQ